MAKPLTETEWAQLLSREPNGQLYGVTTTRILCRFGCASVTPRREHVLVFASQSEALELGFRLCKRCGADVRKGKEMG